MNITAKMPTDHCDECGQMKACGPQLFGTASDPSAIRLIREHYGMMGRC
jgi:hypothetical protein